jgi:chemotaxis protein CheY-P-specific phosphatase CheC
MGDLLTKEEIIFANKLMSLALANSAVSFSQMANTDIKLQAAQIQLKPINNDINPDISVEEKLYMLVSRIIGDIPAHSYLVFKPADATKLAMLCLPPSAQNNDEMQQALQIEMANILTASVVTQLSNFFKVKIFGYIPELKKLTKIELRQGIEKEMDKENVSFFLKTNFITPNLQIQPDFIWTFNHIFIDMIKRMAKSEENELYLSQQKELVAKYIV